jgi:aerobic carbon-monoxide dehydrogenase small subunit
VTEGIPITVTVNGRVVARTAPAHHTLLRWLRDAGVYDVRYGCGEGVCGACTVLVDGEAVNGCLVLAAQVAGSTIRTAVGLTQEDGSMSELQRAFVEHGAVQCGFCTSGMLLAATELLESGERLDRPRIAAALEGNLCRCTGYQAVVEAIQSAAASRREAG